MATARNRSFSSPPEPHALGFMYGWSPTDVATNGLNPYTGLWNPTQVDTSGRLLVSIGDANFTGNLSVALDKTGDSVTAYPPQFSSVSTSVPSGSLSASTTGVALAANTVRKEFYIQAIGTGSPLYIAFNGNAVSPTNLNVVLKAASASYAGDGGLLSNTTYQGPVTVSGAIGCLFTVWEA